MAHGPPHLGSTPTRWQKLGQMHCCVVGSLQRGHIVNELLPSLRTAQSLPRTTIVGHNTNMISSTTKPTPQPVRGLPLMLLLVQLTDRSIILHLLHQLLAFIWSALTSTTDLQPFSKWDGHCPTQRPRTYRTFANALANKSCFFSGLEWIQP